MALTFDQMKTRVANRVGTSDDNATLLNKGQQKLAEMSKRKVKAVLAFVSGVATIPAACLNLKKLAWEEYPINLAPESEFVFPKYDSNSIPTEYQIYNGSIVLDNLYTGNLNIVYTPKPADMALGADTPALTGCEEAIIAYAVWQRYRENEDIKQAAYWKQNWQDEANDWLALDVKQNKQSYRVKARRWS